MVQRGTETSAADPVSIDRFWRDVYTCEPFFNRSILIYKLHFALDKREKKKRHFTEQQNWNPQRHFIIEIKME